MAEIMSDSPEIELLRRAFEALRGGNVAVLADSLSDDARWRTVYEGSTNCEGRGTIIEIMRRGIAGRLRGSIEQTIQTGPRVLVAFRPERPSDAGDRPLDGGIAYMVVTIDDGQITELKGCADRGAALSYLQTGELPEPPSPRGVQQPETGRMQPSR